jgi:hypothetical protein
VAAERNLSIHTVHEYVKKIYEHFGVTSRPKLLALWIERSRRPLDGGLSSSHSTPSARAA